MPKKTAPNTFTLGIRQQKVLVFNLGPNDFLKGRRK